MNGFCTPKEIAEIWVQNGVNKAKLPLLKMFLLGIAAGVYIGFGAHAFLVASAAGETAFEGMAGKLLGAALFPVGLMLVVLCGAELFTGNNLLTLALMQKKITVQEMLRNWGVVYVANLLGSVLLAFVLAKSGLYTGATGARAIAVASSKVGASFMEMVLRGILCNMLVVLACWFQAGSKDLTGKILAIWFPIMLFVFSGFEHSVANMTYISLGMFLGADVSVGDFLLGNLIPVTIGNLIGGAILVPGLYRTSYLQ